MVQCSNILHYSGDIIGTQKAEIKGKMCNFFYKMTNGRIVQKHIIPHFKSSAYLHNLQTLALGTNKEIGKVKIDTNMNIA